MSDERNEKSNVKRKTSNVRHKTTKSERTKHNIAKFYQHKNFGNMKTQLIKIGNSKGIRIPKTIVEQCKLNGELNIEVRQNEIIIKAEGNQRAGWDEAFKKAGSLKQNSMIDDDGINLSDWDENEWKW